MKYKSLSIIFWLSSLISPGIVSAALPGQVTLFHDASFEDGEDEACDINLPPENRAACIQARDEITDWKEEGDFNAHFGEIVVVLFQGSCWIDYFIYDLKLVTDMFTKDPDQGPEDTCEAPPTPIVIDVDGDGFKFTDVHIDSVFFDLDADGIQEMTAWTSTNDDDSFLVYDRNGNGLIDDGSELFGNHSMLLSREKAIHGYHALAEFDSSDWGGNEDGILDKKDSKFKRLRLWTDINSNGISESSELRTMQSKGVRAINVYYSRGPGLDENGNDLKLKSEVLIKDKGREVLRPSIDVVLETSN